MGSSPLFSGYHSSPLHILQYWAKKTQFNFTKWEIHHYFLLVTILHHYIHCNIRQSQTVQFHQVGNSTPFSAGHHCFPLHTLQHWTKQNNNNNKNLFNLTKWEIHHHFLLVTILYHYIHSNTGLKTKTNKNCSIRPSGKFTTVFCWSPFSTITFTATLDKAKQFSFTKWEIHHHFLLVTTVFHYIHCNTGLKNTKTNNNKQKTVQFDQVGNSPLFPAGHQSSPLHTMQQCTKQKSSVSPSGKFTTIFCWSSFFTIAYNATLE